MNTHTSSLASRTKIAIVTGASGNLGQAVIKKFISEGFFVVGTTGPKDSFVPNYPRESFEMIAVDLLNEDASRNFVESVTAKHGHIDVAVLTVGGFAAGKISETVTKDI